MVRLVDGGCGHESVGTGAWWSCALRAWAMRVAGSVAFGASRRVQFVEAHSVRTGARSAIAGVSSLAVAATVAERLKVLPHALLGEFCQRVASTIEAVTH